MWAYGDARSDRVWFSEDLVLNGLSISSIVTRPYIFVNLQKHHQKPKFYQFANKQYIEVRNRLLLVHSSRKGGMMLG